MIRLEAGMPTSRFARLLGVPERSYRRWQQRQRHGRRAKGPWPAPARDRVELAAIAYADRFPAWGHRKVAMLLRVDGHHAPDSTVLRSVRFAAYIERRPELIHIRTRRKSPNQNGVRERAFGSLKYEHLYRHEIDDGHQLGLEVETYRQLFNEVRPHEGIGMRRPLDVHLEAINDRETIKSTEPETLPTP